MNAAIRLSPSGPVVENANGGPLVPGSGMRLRLTETQFTMTGSLAIPASADTVGPAGFGASSQATLTLLEPNADLYYRANVELDVINTSTNTDGEVVLYLDTSVDGGTTWTNNVKTMHVSAKALGNGTAGAVRASCKLLMTAGGSLGVDDDHKVSIKLRARAQLPVGVPANTLVNSAATSGAVTGLSGSVYLSLEECF